MHSFEELSKEFSVKFNTKHFPAQPASLYEPADYFLSLGGKRIRPVLCLMANELFNDIHPDAWHAATAIELFHNFTLIHDDIMDKAPLRRGMQTVHEKFGNSTALLSGDVMLVVAYEYMNKVDTAYLHKIIHVFNKTAKEVCEGQQMDMDFETKESVSLEEYLHMIKLKTSVLLAGSLQMAINSTCMSSAKTLGWHSRCRMIIWMHLATLRNSASRWAAIFFPTKKHFCSSGRCRLPQIHRLEK